MTYKNSVFNVIVVVVMMIGVTFDIHAQFGNLKDKLKEKTKVNTETKKEETVTTTTSSTVQDYGMTDDIHAKHKTKVVFSTTPIVFQKGNEAQLTNSFVFGKDDIFFMAYFEQSYYNRLVKEGKAHFATPDNTSVIGVKGVIYWEVNGTMVGKDEYSSYQEPMGYGEDSFKKWTGLSFPDTSMTKYNRTKLQRAFHCYVVPNLKAGDNKIVMHVNFEIMKGQEKFSPSPAMAIGEFTLKVQSANDIVKHMKDIDYLGERNFAEKAAIDKEIRESLPKEQILKITYYANDWTPQTEYGRIVSRSIPIYIITKNENGKFIARAYSAEQKHMGGGKYGKVTAYTSTRMDLEVPPMLMK